VGYSKQERHLTEKPDGITQHEDDQLLLQPKTLKPWCNNITHNMEEPQCIAWCFLMVEHLFNKVQGCNPTRKSAESDHTAVKLKIHISKLAIKMKDKKLTTKTDWEEIIYDEATNAIYNENLQEITNADKKQQPHPRRIHTLLKERKESGQRNRNENNHTPHGLVQNKQRQNTTTNWHCHLPAQTTPWMH
jgi:hypothetical protein